MSIDNTCRLYQLKEIPENEQVQFRTYREIIGMGRRIHIDQYELAYESSLPPDMTVQQVCDLLAQKPAGAFKLHGLSTGDVIALRQNHSDSAYFVDGENLMTLPDFFAASAASGGGLTIDTANYHIEGKPGLWCVVDTETIGQSIFFLMESMSYGKRAEAIILDAAGHVVLENVRNDFDEAVMQKLRLYLHPGQPHTALPEKPQLERCQRYFENGTYERSGSPEVQSEQNYNMIDGTNNNREPPGRRESIRKRLSEKMALVHAQQGTERELI